MVVKRAGRGYKVYSKSGRPLSKKPKSKAAAMRQLRAVEASKRRRGNAKTYFPDRPTDEFVQAVRTAAEAAR